MYSRNQLINKNNFILIKLILKLTKIIYKGVVYLLRGISIKAVSWTIFEIIKFRKIIFVAREEIYKIYREIIEI